MNKFIIALFLLHSFNIVFSQNLQYRLNFSNPATYEADESCCAVNPAQWEVKNDSCYLNTSLLTINASGEIPIALRINLSGNLENEDKAYIQYNIDESGYATDTIILGAGLAAVFDYVDTLSLEKDQTLNIKIVGITNHITEKWQVKDGDISIFEASDPLPISLLNFNVDYKKPDVKIEWQTATEINNDYFLVLRSVNGYDFEEISQVKGSGNSTKVQTYSITDYDRPKDNTTLYYRLKQVDFNGESESFNIVVLNIEPDNICELDVKPNPCIGRCTVEFDNCNNEEYQEVAYSVYDALGNVVYNSTPKYIEGGTASFSHDVTNNLKPGTYIIRSRVNQDIKTKKVLMK